MFRRKKKKPNLGFYVIVDFSPEAVRLGLPTPKIIYHFYNGYIIKKEIVNDPSIIIRELKADGMFVKDLTRGKEISPYSMFVPKEARIAGVLQTQKFLRGMEIVEKVEDIKKVVK